MHFLMFHVICSGGKLSFMRRRENPVEAMTVLEEDIRKAKPDILILVPALLSGLEQIMKIRRVDGDRSSALAFLGGNLKFILAGGAKVDSSYQEFFGKLGFPVHSGYGMTETTGALTFNLMPDKKKDSVGISSGGKSVLKIFIDGKVTDTPFVIGEIVYRGGILMKGYWNSDTATRAVIDSRGWFHTGDIGHFDADGYLYFDGRLGNLLVSNSGEKYNPEEIENAFCQASTDIKQIMVYNQESPFTLGIVVPSEGGSLTFEGLARVAAMFMKGGIYQGRFPEIWIPKRFLIADEGFTVDNGMLTSKGSFARQRIYYHYKKRIESLYNSKI